MKTSIENTIRKWLKGENSSYSYVGDTKDLTSVVLDGSFDLEELVKAIHHSHKEELEKAVQEFASTLRTLIERGNVETAMNIIKERSVTPNT